MGKKVKVLLYILLFVLTVSLNASTLNNSIVQISSRLKSAGKSDIVRIYHDLKSRYIKAIIIDDKEAQISAIKGLVKCSKILKLPYEHYLDELSLLQKNDTKNKTKKSRPSYGIKKSSYIKSIASFKDKVVLTLNRKIDKSDIKFYELNSKKRYRDVFDIKTKLKFKVKKISLYGVKSIRISQYNSKTVRIVLESSKPVNSIFSIEKDKVIIKVDQKTYQTSKKIYYKKPVKNSYVSKYFTPVVKQKIVIIDPGHGGKDTGAIGYKRLREKNAVLKIALKLGRYLKEYGYKVYYTRSRDVFIKLRSRTHFANIKKADIFISIHANAAPRKSQYLVSKGIETYFLSPARSARAKRVSAQENSVDLSSMDYFSKQVFLNFLNREKIVSSNKLAIDIQRGILKNIRKKYRVVDGGVRKAPFWVLVGAQMPAVLVETGYITNPTEAKRLFNPYYEDLLAKGIADGIAGYFEKNR
jgi:N-acetylmuramoyl-L-alanine amidase